MKDLSMYIMDIIQNSTRAKATEIGVDVFLDNSKDTLTLIFKDNGCGMDKQMAEKVTDPFFTTRTTRKVGLGLALLKQNAEMTGGFLKIESHEGSGTTITAVFGLTHIDTPPMGDLPGALTLTISANPDIRFLFHYKRDEEVDYLLDTNEVYEILDGMSIHDPNVIESLKEMILENIR